MAVNVTSDHVAAASGVPFASATDEAWAQTAADSATDYVNAPDIADQPLKARQAQHGAVMLAVWLYKRRPSGTVEPGFEFTPTSDEVTAFYTLLQLGRHAPPVIA